MGAGMRGLSIYHVYLGRHPILVEVRKGHPGTIKLYTGCPNVCLAPDHRECALNRGLMNTQNHQIENIVLL